MADFNELIRDPKEDSAKRVYESIVPKKLKDAGNMEEVNQGIANNTNSEEMAEATLSTTESAIEDIMGPAINHIIVNHLESIQRLASGMLDMVIKGIGM